MSITGNLRTMELAELLQWLSGAQKTGTLVLDNRQVEKRIFFRDGRIISSSSTDPKEYLGHFLVSHGYIEEETLSRAVQMQEANKMLLGKILVEMGGIGEADLHRMLRLKAEESIYDIFAWAEGDFRFLDQELPSMTMVPIALDVTGIVLEGMQRLDEWKRIRESIPVVSAIPVAIAAWDESELDAGARHALSLINDDRSVEEICVQTHSSEFYVCRILYRQLQAGRLKIVRPRSSAAATPRDSDQLVALNAESLVQAARRHLTNRELEMAVRYIRAARSLDPESKKMQVEVQKVEDAIRDTLEKAGVMVTSIPVLTRTMEELTQLRISPQEGFLLTRINGSYDIQSLLKISPMPPLDAQIVFWKLVKAGHIRLERRRA